MTTATTEPRTRAWQPRECAIVDGLKVVYTATPAGLLLHLPGGRTATAQDLRHEGRLVIEPRVPRLDDDAPPPRQINASGAIAERLLRG